MKLAVVAVMFECLYEEFGEKGRDNKMYRLSKVRERKARDMGEVRNILDNDGRVLMDKAKIRKRWQSYFHILLNRRGKNIMLGDLEHSSIH